MELPVIQMHAQRAARPGGMTAVQARLRPQRD